MTPRYDDIQDLKRRHEDLTRRINENDAQRADLLEEVDELLKEIEDWKTAFMEGEE